MFITADGDTEVMVNKVAWSLICRYALGISRVEDQLRRGLGFDFRNIMTLGGLRSEVGDRKGGGEGRPAASRPMLARVVL
jgi:hypothetical protein